jgi:hypothetical protein
MIEGPNGKKTIFNDFNISARGNALNVIEKIIIEYQIENLID